MNKSETNNRRHSLISFLLHRNSHIHCLYPILIHFLLSSPPFPRFSLLIHVFTTPLVHIMTEIRVGLFLEGCEVVEVINEQPDVSWYRVRSQQFNRVFVAKVVPGRDDDIDCPSAAYETELNVLLRLNHPNIVRPYKHFQFGDKFVIFLEDLPNGTLEDHMKVHGPIRGPLLIRTVKDLCAVVSYMWSEGVQHRNICPSNLTLDENGRLKLINFDLALLNSDSSEIAKVRDFRVPNVSAAPEILKRIPHDPVLGEIWAVGVAILWMTKGKAPWPSDSRAKLVHRLLHNEYDMDMDAVLYRLVKRMLQIDPDNRWFPIDEELDDLGSDGFVVQTEKIPTKSGTKGGVSCKTKSLRPMGSFRLMKADLPKTRVEGLKTASSLRSMSGMIKQPLMAGTCQLPLLNNHSTSQEIQTASSCPLSVSGRFEEGADAVMMIGHVSDGEICAGPAPGVPRLQRPIPLGNSHLKLPRPIMAKFTKGK